MPRRLLRFDALKMIVSIEALRQMRQLQFFQGLASSVFWYCKRNVCNLRLIDSSVEEGDQ